MSAQDPTVSAENNGSALLTTACATLTLTWLSVFLRTYVRIFLTKQFLLDDWLMVAAQANFTISCAFILSGYSHGLGRHNKSLDILDEIASLKWQVLATATYILNMWLIKMSIGIFLLRLASQRRYRYTLYVAVSVVTVWSLVLFFWNVFQCNPVQAQWDYTILATDPSARCVSVDQVVSAAYALSVMTILSDWLFALLPIPMVWNVKMTLQAKITVTAVLGVGIFASVATLVRLKYLSDLTEVSDILFAGTNAMVWTLLEPALAIIASSLATIRPLLRAWGINGFQVSERSRSGFRSDKRPKNAYGAGSKRAMPGFGSDDVSSADVELAYSRGSDAKSSTKFAITASAEEPGIGIQKSTTARAESRYNKIGIQRTTSIRQTSATVYPATSSALPPPTSTYDDDNNAARIGLSVHSVEDIGRERYKGDTFLHSDHGSISSIELATMQPQLAGEGLPLPYGPSARRK